MDINFSTDFEKQYNKLPEKIQVKFDKRLLLFIDNPRDPLLRTRQLKGNKKHLISINITGSYRALFIWMNERTVLFDAIGTHSQLYG